MYQTVTIKTNDATSSSLWFCRKTEKDAVCSNKAKQHLMVFIPLLRLGLRPTLLSCRHSQPSVLQVFRHRSFTPPFFSRSVRQLNSRPYPHRQFNQQPKKQPFLHFLDDIPRNTVFWTIITINGLVFVMWFMASQRVKQNRDYSSYKWMVDNFTDSWRNMSSGRIWTLATSCFSHEDVPHILFNGFTFFFMARPVLSILGSRRFIFLYMGGGIFANIASLAWSNFVKHRDNGSHGASAAIYSVVSFLACVAPRMTFQLYGIIPIPAWLAVTGIFAYDTYSAINDKRRTTDTAGHVAGLLAGVGYFLARRLWMF